MEKKKTNVIIFPLVPVSNSFAIQTGLNTIPPVVAGPFTHLKMHRLQKVIISENSQKDDSS